MTPSCIESTALQPPSFAVNHFWSPVIGAGRAHEGLRADWQAHLAQVTSACGFRYVRFHGLFHDDMHVYSENKDGKPVFNFQYVDALFDALLDMGVRPFVELGFMPSALASGPETVFWWKANISPPKHMRNWSALVHAITSHWISRYGLDEVRTWYFECWNEPNLSEFWAGSRSDYYDLYKATVLAIKSIDESLRVGGPATSNYVPDTRFDGEREDLAAHDLLNHEEDIDSLSWRPVWIEHFLTWCSSQKLPVDFISCHPYPTDWALDTSGTEIRRVRKLDATPEDIRLIKDIVSSSAYPSAEIHLTEWSSSPSSRDHSHDYVPAAIYLLRTLLASLNLVDSISYWTFTDVFEEAGAGPEPLHGGFGMINLQGIPKPTFHAFRFLYNLGDEGLAFSKNDGIITRCSKTGKLAAVLFHYPPEHPKTPPISFERRDEAEETLTVGKPTTKFIKITDLKPGTVFKLEELSPGKPGDVVSEWKRAGAPKVLSRQVTMELKRYSSELETTVLKADGSGSLVVSRELAPWTALLLTQS